MDFSPVVNIKVVKNQNEHLAEIANLTTDYACTASTQSKSFSLDKNVKNVFVKIVSHQANSFNLKWFWTFYWLKISWHHGTILLSKRKAIKKKLIKDVKVLKWLPGVHFSSTKDSPLTLESNQEKVQVKYPSWSCNGLLHITNIHLLIFLHARIINLKCMYISFGK